MEAIPLNNVIICINRQTITSSNNNGNGSRSSSNKKLSNVIFHRFNAFWLFSFTQTNRAECQKVKWNANEKLSLSIRHSLTGCLSPSLSLSGTRAHICILLERFRWKESIENLVFQFGIQCRRRFETIVDFEKCSSLDNNGTILSICYWFSICDLLNSLTIPSPAPSHTLHLTCMHMLENGKFLKFSTENSTNK